MFFHVMDGLSARSLWLAWGRRTAAVFVGLRNMHRYNVSLAHAFFFFHPSLTWVPTIEPNINRSWWLITDPKKIYIDSHRSLPIMMPKITRIVRAMIIFHFKSFHHIRLRTWFAPRRKWCEVDWRSSVCVSISWVDTIKRLSSCFTSFAT